VSLGNVAGGALGAAVLSTSEWPAVFTYSALVMGAGAVALVVGLKGATPADEGRTSSVGTEVRGDAVDEELVVEEHDGDSVDSDRPVTFREALLLPGVIPFAATNACTKGVSYSLLFWLPLYLTQHLHEGQGFAVAMATLYDVGGVAGGLAFGYLSDKLLQRGWARSISIAGLLVGSGITVQLYYLFGGVSLALNVVLMVLVGAFANSAYNLINSTIAADLGSQSDRLGGRSARSTVTGIIDASGSAGAALSQPLVALLDTTYGWSGVFAGLTLMCILSCLLLTPTVVRDLRNRQRQPVDAPRISIEPLLLQDVAADGPDVPR
jgi:OPA family glycerol-3-phosphate transporter-like MFS transporter 1/2